VIAGSFEKLKGASGILAARIDTGSDCKLIPKLFLAAALNE
jgi:hypothetical protein